MKDKLKKVVDELQAKLIRAPYEEALLKVLLGAIQEIVDFEAALKKSKSELNNSLQEIVDLEAALKESKSEHNDSLCEIAEFENKLPKTLYDEYKRKVADRLYKNLSLAQLEKMEAFSKTKVNNYAEYED